MIYKGGKISCPAGHINIIDAYYGRVDGGAHCGPNDVGKCHSFLNYTSLAEAECNGKPKCTFKGVSGMLPDGPSYPCSQAKYTRMRFTCSFTEGEGFPVQPGHVYQTIDQMYKRYQFNVEFLVKTIPKTRSNLVYVTSYNVKYLIKLDIDEEGYIHYIRSKSEWKNYKSDRPVTLDKWSRLEVMNMVTDENNYHLIVLLDGRAIINEVTSYSQ